MQDIKHREEKMKEKRRNTPWREFVKEICSWTPLNIYKHNFGLARFPVTSRSGSLLIPEEFNKYGIDKLYNENYDINHGFFDDFSNFYKKHPKPSLYTVRENENSAYSDSLFGVKNAYLSFATGDDSENILYSYTVYAKVRNIINSVFIIGNCENIFFCTDITQSFNIFYSRFIINCNNIRFSTNLTGCVECMECSGLNNNSYCIKNKQYSKEEYLLEKQKILSEKNLFMQRYLNNTKILGENIGNKNISGQRIIYSENIESGLLVSYLKNGRNLCMTAGVNSCTNFYNCFEVGFDSHDIYGVSQAGTYSQKLYCSNFIDGGSDIYYSFLLENCSFCLGCIGLKNKSFCILNKQYTKEERFELANKIFEQMDKNGTLGKFFPASMNPFYFNDTVAYLIDDSFTKDEVTKEGYLWRDEKIKVDIQEGKEIILTSPLTPFLIGECGDQREPGEVKTLNDFQGFDSNGNRVINPEIIKKVIEDKEGNYYTIQKMELEFLQKYGLPLPEIHRLDRIKLGFKFK